jgi:hypothetical protein
MKDGFVLVFFDVELFTILLNVLFFLMSVYDLVGPAGLFDGTRYLIVN